MAKKAAPRLRLTDTTFRDGNQSLLGGRLRPAELLPIAKKMDAIGFNALEAFGGATFETYLRLGEDPWDYLQKLAKQTPNTPLQALIRGQNLVGHRNYADDAVELFIKHAAKSGVEIFRVFDPLNDVRNMECAIRAAKKAKRKVQGALCYAISPAHNLDLWCSLARGVVELGADEVVVKDTSGLLSPQAAWELVTALKETVSVPIDVHSHCSSGMAPMAYMAAIEAGAEIVDTAISPLAWGASQPAAESMVAALAGGDYDTGLDLDRLVEVKVELDRVKAAHAGEGSPFADRVDSEILKYHMPGAMLERIHELLAEHRAEGRIADVLNEVSHVRKDLGYPPLVAPLREMVAVQAVFNVTAGDRYATVSQELKDYLQGLYGRPPQEADASIRRLVLGHEDPITIRPADLIDPQVEGARSQLKKQGLDGDDGSVLTYLLFPSLGLKFLKGELAPAGPEPAGEPSGEGEEPSAEGKAESAPEPAPADEPAQQSAEFEVEVEGEVFKVRVSGSGIVVGAAPGGGGGGAPAPAPKAAPKQGSVTAPMQGLIVKLPKKPGDEVKLGDVVAVLEAMKMQNDIVATAAGKVLEVYVKEGEVVSPNQAILAVG